MSVFEASVIVLWILLLVVLVLLAGIVRRLGAQQRQLAEFMPVPGLKVGERAPAATATAVDGGEVGWGAAAGEPSVLGFFSSHCRACRDELPAFNAVGAAVGERGMEAVAIIDGETDDAAHLLAGLRPPVRAVLAPFGASKVLPDLRVSSFPSYLAIGTDGTVLAAAESAPALASALGLPEAAAAAGGR